MTQVIWEFPLDASIDRQVVDMPASARVLSVAEQHGKLTVWALWQRGDARIAPKLFEIRGTGEDFALDASMRFLGTVLLAGGGYVVHVFVQEEDR